MSTPTTPTKLSDITVQDVKDYYGVTDNSKDARIAVMLPVAVDFITKYCNSDFEVKSRTETINVETETTTFFLKYRPISSVTSIIVDGVTLVADQDYYVDKDTGAVEKLLSETNTNYSIFNKGPWWTTKKNVIVVTYVAGQELKQDVSLVLKELTGIYTDLNQKVFVDVEGNQTATNYDKMPQELYAILDRYKQTFHI